MFASRDNEHMSFLLDLAEKEKMINTLKEIKLAQNSEVFLRTYEFLVLNPDDSENIEKYSLGNWSKTEVTFRNSPYS